MLLTVRSLYYCIVGFYMNAYLDLPDSARLAAFTTPSVADHFGFGVLLCACITGAAACWLTSKGSTSEALVPNMSYEFDNGMRVAMPNL